MAAAAGKQNKRRRRRRKSGAGARVALLIFGVLVIILAIVLAMTMFFKIKKITVVGQSPYSEKEIVAASGIETDKNMFLFNKFLAQSRIFSEFPYIDELTIRRKLPDLIEITVKECIPVAVIHTNSLYEQEPIKKGQPVINITKEEYYIIDNKGKLLQLIDKEEAFGFCIIEGGNLINPSVGKKCQFIDEQKSKPLFLVLNSALDSGILQNIGTIDISKTYDIIFTYLGLYDVKIGTSEFLDKKLRYMHLIINEHLSPNDKGTIDVSNVQTARFIAKK